MGCPSVSAPAQPPACQTSAMRHSAGDIAPLGDTLFPLRSCPHLRQFGAVHPLHPGCSLGSGLRVSFHPCGTFKPLHSPRHLFPLRSCPHLRQFGAHSTAWGLSTPDFCPVLEPLGPVLGRVGRQWACPPKPQSLGPKLAKNDFCPRRSSTLRERKRSIFRPIGARFEGQGLELVTRRTGRGVWGSGYQECKRRTGAIVTPVGCCRGFKGGG